MIIVSGRNEGQMEICIILHTKVVILFHIILKTTFSFMLISRETHCEGQLLTLKAPNKNCSRRHFNFLLLSFEENKV